MWPPLAACHVKENAIRGPSIHGRLPLPLDGSGSTVPAQITVSRVPSHSSGRRTTRAPRTREALGQRREHSILGMGASMHATGSVFAARFKQERTTSE